VLHGRGSFVIIFKVDREVNNTKWFSFRLYSIYFLGEVCAEDDVLFSLSIQDYMPTNKKTKKGTVPTHGGNTTMYIRFDAVTRIVLNHRIRNFFFFPRGGNPKIICHIPTNSCL
jgi:hypothetical protein